MSADGGKRRSATQIAALLLAMVPLVTGIYQEAQENRSRRADVRETREKALRQQRTADEQADKATAKQLADALLGLDPDSEKGEGAFCSHIYLAIAQLDDETRSPRTATLINASLLMRNADNTGLRICDCTLGGGVGPLWFSGFSAADRPGSSRASSQGLLQALGGAQQDCRSTRCEAVEEAAVETCAGGGASSAGCRAALDRKAKLCLRGEVDPEQRIRTLEAQLTAAEAKLTQAQADPDKACAPLAHCPGDFPLVGSAAGNVKNPPGDPKPNVKPSGGTADTDTNTHTTKPDCTVEQPVGDHRRRVFIQVPDAISRSLAEPFRAAINAASPFKTPAIEVVGLSRSPERLQIRYAYGQDRDSAEKLKTALDSGACGIPQSKVGAELYPMPRLQGRTEPGVLEVWWPRN